jgi:GNAT superfamily N-acetyltransferase
MTEPRGIAVREARLPDDKPVLLGFIDGLQRYEAAFEADRRLDAAYAEDQFAELFKKAERGAIFVAENDDRLAGWILVIEVDGPAYVIEEERRYACICELFVDEAVRGQGAGRALMAACEDWARAKNLATIHIGHLAENARAAHVYDKAGYAPYVVLRRKRL